MFSFLLILFYVLAKNIKYAFSIVRTDKSADVGKLIMCAKTQTDKDNWISAINSAISLYMTPEITVIT